MDEQPTIMGAYRRIEGHEELCAERYDRINTTLTSLAEGQSAQSKLLWGVLLSIAGFLGAVLVAVVLHALNLT